jgi:hypothetical protein
MRAKRQRKSPVEARPAFLTDQADQAAASLKATLTAINQHINQHWGIEKEWDSSNSPLTFFDFRTGTYKSLDELIKGALAQVSESNTAVDLGSGARDARNIMFNAADIAALQDHDLKILFQATAAEVKKRGLEVDANEPPRPAQYDDTRLGRLLARYEKRLREIELPEGGFTTKEQAAAGARLAQTLRHLQNVQRDLDLPVTETPEKVSKAEALASVYRYRHDETGAFKPPRRRGRPRRVRDNGVVLAPS